jgi:muramoyltetrapeptide carboxypeptidase
VEGEVAGGCLSLVASSVGTPYALVFHGRIAFLEETGEPAYRLDRMLHQLKASGAFEGALALVFGVARSFGPEADAEHLEHLLEELAAAVPFPVLEGLPCGHTEPNLPLPFGPRAVLDPSAGTLAFLEPLVEEPS